MIANAPLWRNFIAVHPCHAAMSGSLFLLLSILGSAAGALLPSSEGGRSAQLRGRTRGRSITGPPVHWSAGPLDQPDQWTGSPRMTALEKQCREFASSLQPPSCTEQQDDVRARLQHTIRSTNKWRDAHVHAYGSTACGLHAAASDFDFTVCGAQFAMEAKQACLQQAAAHCRRVELASPAAADLLTLRDLAQGDVRKATQLHADQTTSFKSKSKKLERMSEDVAVWTRAGSGRSVHERALSLWPLASLAELEEWMADELHATQGRVVRLKAEVVAAEARLARHTHSLSEVREADTNAVEHIEESRLAVGQAR